jgi:hypothetical protein
MPDPLPYKFSLTKERAEILKENYCNLIAIEPPDNDGLCQVHLRVDNGFDLLSLFQAGCIAGAAMFVNPLLLN